MELATRRLASGLAEKDHEVHVVHSDGDDQPVSGVGFLSAPEMAASNTPSPDARNRIRRLVGKLAPDVVVAVNPPAWALQLSSDVSPTILYAMDYSAICADGTRYWSRFGHACGVRAGVKCAVLRPVMACSGVERSLSLNPAGLARQRHLERLLNERSIPVLVPSVDTRNRFVRNGLAPNAVAVLPNLGLRMSIQAIGAAATGIPAERRDEILFMGRLARTKGVDVLPPLARALSPPMRVRVYGRGDLESTLRAKMPGDIFPPVSQDRVMGLLAWARGVVFPSRWPEPGGIVGIDAQLSGVPLAAYPVGAALDWPRAKLAKPGDVRGLVSWARRLEPTLSPRDPDRISAAQHSYWEGVLGVALALLGNFQHSGGFASVDSGHVLQTAVERNWPPSM
jgi:glycosyltransferase involved in cell wall biosynthesis